MVGIEGPQMSISIIPVCVRVCVWNRMRRWGGGITFFCEVERDGGSLLGIQSCTHGWGVGVRTCVREFRKSPVPRSEVTGRAVDSFEGSGLTERERLNFSKHFSVVCGAGGRRLSEPRCGYFDRCDYSREKKEFCG